MKKDIIIVRHAQSTANVNSEGLLSSTGEYVIDSNFDITHDGQLQAFVLGKKIARLINTNEFEMFVSPYKRTRKTAKYIISGIKIQRVSTQKRVSISYIEDPRLVEQDFGDFDFQFRDKWKEISPHSYYINQERFNDSTGRFFARLENGENLLDVYNRVSLFVTTRLERSNKKCSIIVTHGNTMKIFKMFLLNEPVEKFKETGVFPNAAALHFVYDDQKKEYEFLGLI